MQIYAMVRGECMRQGVDVTDHGSVQSVFARLMALSSRLRGKKIPTAVKNRIRRRI